MLLAVVDGLKGFPEAIVAVFPDAMVQTCIVHLLRPSLDFVSYKQGPQAGRRGAEGDLQGAGRRGRRRRARRLRGRRLGAEAPRHRPELAPGLAGGERILAFGSFYIAAAALRWVEQAGIVTE